MSEQQFALDKLYYSIMTPIEKKKISVGRNYITYGEVVDLLNELATKCSRLENENEQLEKGKMEALSLLGEEIDKNEQLRQVVEEYRKTNKHLSELCADASKNGYLPPLDDIVRKSEIKDAWKQRTEKRWNDV